MTKLAQHNLAWLFGKSRKRGIYVESLGTVYRAFRGVEMTRREDMSSVYNYVRIAFAVGQTSRLSIGRNV
jgi:hypothetical protein